MRKTAKMRVLEQRYGMSIADLLLTMNWEQQIPMEQMAHKLGICDYTVRAWFKRLQLTPFFPQGRPALDRKHGFI